MTLRPPEQTYVRTATDLTELWRDLMGPGGFDIRSLWMIFIGDDGQLMPVVSPIEGIPLEPDEQVANLGRVIAHVLDGTAGTAAFLLSRPGERWMSPSDCRWAKAVRDAVDAQLSPWPVHLATRGTIRVFTPDDLIAA